MFIKAGSHINIELNIELECFVLKLQNFTLNQNKTFLFDIELNIEGLKACLNEPLVIVAFKIISGFGVLTKIRKYKKFAPSLKAKALKKLHFKLQSFRTFIMPPTQNKKQKVLNW